MTKPAKNDENSSNCLDDKDALEEAVQAVRDFLQSLDSSLTTAEILLVVKQEQRASVLLARERLRILFRGAVLAATKKDTSKPSKMNLPDAVYMAAARLVRESALMRRYMEGYAIACLEEAVCLLEGLKPVHFVLLLQTCYEQEVLEEATILQWWSQDDSTLRIVSEATHERLHKASQPFIKWLQEAETESSTDEEND